MQSFAHYVTKSTSPSLSLEDQIGEKDRVIAFPPWGKDLAILLQENLKRTAEFQRNMQAEAPANLRTDQAELPSEAVIFGGTAAMREIRDLIERALHNDLPVLIQGESGTGKEVVGRFLHAHGERSHGPFIKLNCAAMSSSLLESELFGHEKGAFAGANEVKPGLVEVAEGGTVFLDEIGAMDWELQAKLLKMLQDGCYSRVGGTEERLARVRVICATNTNLEAAVEKRAFRQDLLFHLEMIGLHMVPLRERKEDIPQLCEYLLTKQSREFGKEAPHLSPAALHLLKQWKWPGNLRELENWIARIIIFGTEEVLGLELRRQLLFSFPGNQNHRISRFQESPNRRIRRRGRQ
jgi:two-component system response regulator AtoC